MASWVSFDCYGTLIDWDRGIGDALTGLWPDADRERLLTVYHAVEPVIQEMRPALSYREVLDGARGAVASILGLDPGTGNVLADSLPSWPPFPEVPDVLRHLRESGRRLAILSNTDRDLLAASIERIGVPFDVTVTAADAGSYKPAPGHWERFDALSGAREAHVHVAASLFHDIEPCSRMGIPAVWINRLGEESDLPRAAELATLQGLPETLEGGI
ncbi:MAG TPA: HAD-IA family hydrolase [Actinomycetota bacterium]|nr:HAD-IA family hydrolase [Actinomycetota bacterium]